MWLFLVAVVVVPGSGGGGGFGFLDFGDFVGLVGFWFVISAYQCGLLLAPGGMCLVADVGVCVCVCSGGAYQGGAYQWLECCVLKWLHVPGA